MLQPTTRPSATSLDIKDNSLLPQPVSSLPMLNHLFSVLFILNIILVQLKCMNWIQYCL